MSETLCRMGNAVDEIGSALQQLSKSEALKTLEFVASIVAAAPDTEATVKTEVADTDNDTDDSDPELEKELETIDRQLQRGVTSKRGRASTAGKTREFVAAKGEVTISDVCGKFCLSPQGARLRLTKAEQMGFIRKIRPGVWAAA